MAREVEVVGSLKELKDERERERENAGSVQRKNKILKKI